MNWNLDFMALTSMAIPTPLGWKENRESECPNDTDYVLSG